MKFDVMTKKIEEKTIKNMSILSDTEQYLRIGSFFDVLVREIKE